MGLDLAKICQAFDSDPVRPPSLELGNIEGPHVQFAWVVNASTHSLLIAIMTPLSLVCCKSEMGHPHEKTCLSDCIN